MTEPVIQPPALVLTLKTGERFIAGPGTTLQLRPRNKNGPSFGLGDLAALELHVDEDDERSAHHPMPGVYREITEPLENEPGGGALA